LLAGVGTGLFRDEADAVERCVQVRDVVQPDADRQQRYRELFPLYCEIHDALAGVYSKLAQVLQNHVKVK
jgi:sugar (pentulose or hexulose) kinase